MIFSRFFSFQKKQYYFSFSLETSPTSEIEFAMDKLGGDKNINKDLEGGTQPKKSSRRHLLNNLLDFLAIAASM